MKLESIAPMSENVPIKLPTVAARPSRPYPPDAAWSTSHLHHS